MLASSAAAPVTSLHRCPGNTLVEMAFLLERRASALRLLVAALVEQRYDWAAIGRRFTALVEETVQARRPLSYNGS